MKRYFLLFVALIVLSANSFGQKIVYDKPDFILHIAPEDSNDGFGYSRALGHFNNDHYQDLVILAPHYHNLKGEKVGKLYLYYGNANGIDTSSVLEIEGIHPVINNHQKGEWDNRGLHTLAISDFNNDGYDDLVTGTPWYQRISSSSDQARGYVIVYFSNGDGSGLNLNNPLEFQGYTSNGCYGVSIKSGDVNGDNFADLLVSARYDEGYEGRIYIYYGGNIFDNVYDKALKSTGGRQGLWCEAIGDVNGDLFNDVIGWDWGSWSFKYMQLYVWLGGSNMTITPSYSRLAPFKAHCKSVDLNNDSFDDMIISDGYWHNPPQISPNISVIKGSNNFDLNNEIEFVFEGFDSYVPAITDVNNDGIKDIFVNIYNENKYIISYVFSGDETNYIDISDTLLQFVDSDLSYGSSVWSVVPADINGDGEYEYYANSQMKPYKDVIFIYNTNFPALTITIPNTSGTEWKTHKEYPIHWNSKGNVGPSVKLELYKGSNLHRIIAESTDNDGSHKWTVPPELQTGPDFKIKISSVNDPAVYDFSDHFFTIKQVPNLKITYPDSTGIIWYWGQNRTILWQSWGQVAPNVKLELYRNDRPLRIINFSAVNNGSYRKTISPEDSTGDNFKIKVTDVGNDSVFDFSDQPFSIYEMVGVPEKTTGVYNYRLYPCYPNPFNASTRISFEIAQPGEVQVCIYNLIGKTVKTLLSDHQAPGSYELFWDSRDDRNQTVSSGIFFLEVRTQSWVARQKITLLK